MTERAKAYMDHIAVIKLVAHDRVERHGHRHRDGWEHCPICSVPGDYSRCGWDACQICGTN